VLYQESLRIWRGFVHLGIALLAIGGLALTAAVAVPFGREDAASALAVLVVAGAAVQVARHRPLVGVTD